MMNKVPNDFLILLIEKSEKEMVLSEAERRKIPIYVFLRNAVLSYLGKLIFLDEEGYKLKNKEVVDNVR